MRLGDIMEKVQKGKHHKSSFWDLDANIVVLMVWLGPIVLNAIFTSINYLGIIVPLAFLLIEKKSMLVRNHAGQSLTLYIATGVLYFVLSFLSILFTGGAYYTASPDGTVDVGRLAGLGIGGFLMMLPKLMQLVFIIIACIRGWNWEEYHLPFIGQIGDWFTKNIQLK